MIVPLMISDSPRPGGVNLHACLRTLASATCWLLLFAPVAALAQNSGRRVELPELAHAVPADAGIFIEIEGLTGINTLLSQRDTWRALRHMLGDEQDGWQKLLADTLGVKSAEDTAALFRERVAVAARDWEHLADGNHHLHAAEPRTPCAARPTSRVTRRRKRIGDVRVMQSETGLWIAKHGRTVILIAVVRRRFAVAWGGGPAGRTGDRFAGRRSAFPPDDERSAESASRLHLLGTPQWCGGNHAADTGGRGARGRHCVVGP